MDFYNSLIKPSWTPPDWVFPAMWFTLWTLQAVAVIVMLASERDGASSNAKRVAVAVFVAQFVISIAWQAVVFGPGRLALAAVWLVGATTLVLITVVLFGRISRVAGLLMAPTFAWMCVATALGWTLWKLNPAA